MAWWQALMNYGVPLALSIGQGIAQRKAQQANLGLGRFLLGGAPGVFGGDPGDYGYMGRRAQEGIEMAGRGADELKAMAGGRTSMIGGQYQRFGAEIERQQQALGAQVGGQYGDLSRYFGNAWTQRTADISGELEGLGTQAKKDITQRYKEIGASRQQQLRQRGLAGSTVGAALQTGVEREREAEFGRLGEQLRRERIGTMSALTGQELGARTALEQQRIGNQERLWQTNINTQERLMSNRLNLLTGLTGDQLQAHQLLLNTQLGAHAGYTGDYANMLANVNLGYPTSNAMSVAQGIGAGSYPVPDYGSSGLQALGLGASGAAAGLGAVGLATGNPLFSAGGMFGGMMGLPF